jgi:DNA excision repair protein ERCC-5
MGVTGLWTVLQPCARPIKIETLNKKRLAVDASIWIYQFLKAVRDKEGNALRNSHVVGFFRRICKLLFFGIKPVFVFDGGAPALKRQTISNRKSRREGRREDAARTAGKLLAIQMQRAAEEEEKRRKERPQQPQDEPEEVIPENVVYADEVFQSQQERLKNRKFKKKDQYHLPELGASLSEMGGQQDPRIMSLEELEEYARQFDRGEDINVYDFSKIDFDSPFFVSLPAADRYNILNAARLRSRLRMGYSKDQLDTMFPDRMEFSRFQIERVRERNELTQRLMNINGMSDDTTFGFNSTNRVAGQRDREYVLVKNDGVEGGWALGVVTNKDEGKAEKPIDLDQPAPAAEDDEWEDEDEFEDVPIEGLNRLPKPKPRMTAEEEETRAFLADDLARRRQQLYKSRQHKIAQPKSNANSAVEDPDSLFLAENVTGSKENDQTDELFQKAGDDEEEAELQKAIALSLGGIPKDDSPHESEEEDIYREVFQQERVPETAPFSKGAGLAIARQANQRSNKITSRGPFDHDSESEEDGMDLQAALAESRRSKRAVPKPRPMPKASINTATQDAKTTTEPRFNGPLPFESLNLGNSILGKKKMQKIEEDNAGGFEREIQPEKKKTVEALPPWFEGGRDLKQELREQRLKEAEDWTKASKEQEEYQLTQSSRLRQENTQEVVDLEAPPPQQSKKPIFIDSDDDMEMEDVAPERPKAHTAPSIEGANVPTEEFDQPSEPQEPSPTEPQLHTVLDEESVEWSDSQPEKEAAVHNFEKRSSKSPSMEFEDVPITSTNESERISPNSPPRASQTSKPREASPFQLQGPEDLEIPIAPAADEPPEYIADDESDNEYSDPEDAELFASLAAEAEEHARFAQELSSNAARINFEDELKQLRAQQKKDRRDADEVTQTMISECQHLLTLFGLPYITAPMEAEAQCAELVRLGLVDGIVTDDSDTFLFGGTRVYKNMFNAAKFVECYLANDLATEFSLTREKLIDIAQLLGSDYTSGIPGVGPVTALEILSEFGDLVQFKEWWTGVQEGRIPKEADKSSPFRRRFRRSQATKLFLPTNFPDPRVKEAYLEPEVDSDPQPFQWGVPDLDALRTFLSSQIGWSWERTDEVLVPVIRDMNRREKEGTQSNITRFFEGSVGAGAFAPRVRDDAAGSLGMLNARRKGKGRLGAALTKLAEKDKESKGEGEAEDGEAGQVNDTVGSTQPGGTADAPISLVDSVQQDGPGKRKRKAGTVKSKKSTAGNDAAGHDEAGDDEYTEPRQKARKSAKKRPGRPKRDA